MTSSATTEPDLAAIAEKVLTESISKLGLASAEMPRAVCDATGDYSAAVRDGIAAADQLRADLGELAAKSDLLPAAGRERLRNEALQEAQTRRAAIGTRPARDDRIAPAS